METVLRIFSGSHTLEVNLEARNFLGILARGAMLVGLKRHHLLVRYPVVNVYPCTYPILAIKN